MDPMDWLENEELLRFFHRHKTEMSCLEKPHTFLSQLRDHDLVAEDKYKVSYGSGNMHLLIPLSSTFMLPHMDPS